MTDVGTSQRDAIKQLSPPWLATGVGEKIMYGFGLLADAALEKLNQGVKARMPMQCDASALPYIGNDRVLTQGPFEAQASFRLRLKTAFDAWQRAGSRRAVLQQVLGFFNGTMGTASGTVPIGTIVSTSSAGTYATWDTQYNTSDTTKPPAHVSVTPGNWNWDGNYRWWRAWLIFFFQPGSTITNEGTWGDGDKWGDATKSWGFNTPASTFTLLRSLVSLWKSANTFYQWFIFDLAGSTGAAGSEFSPNSAAGSGNPNGTWGSWGSNQNGCWAPARATDSRYVDGPWQALNCFVPTSC